MIATLITGAGGFTAAALAKQLTSDSQRKIFFTDLRLRPEGPSPLQACDLADFGEVKKLLMEIRPQQIFHLAGTFSNNFDTDYRANFLGAKNIFDAILEIALNCRVLLVGSAAEYGNVGEADVAISENCPLNPVSVYGLTKQMQTQLMHFYVRKHKMDLVLVRPFNLLGKGMSNKLFVGTVYEQIEKLKNGSISKIVLGNLEARRDYVSVEEAVRDYLLIMQKGKSGEIYNVASGHPIRMANLLEKILTEEGLDMACVESKNFSSSSVEISFADVAKLKELKGML